MMRRADVREWMEFQWPYLMAFLGGAARVRALAEQTVSFSLGTQRLPAVTNSDGQATVTFLLSDRPGDWYVEHLLRRKIVDAEDHLPDHPAKSLRQAREGGPIARKLMGLGVVDHLDAMFDAAEETVGLLEVG